MIPTIESRIEELETRVEWIEKYLARQVVNIAPKRTVPPPPIVNIPPAPQAPVAPTWTEPQRPPNVTFTTEDWTPPEKVDAEFILGARVLPRIGAVLVLLGLSFFAGWAYTNGLISPWMAFLGEVVVSVAFLALGFGLGRSKEQFGEVLKAVGSAGLFTSLAAGHLYHHVFNAEAMVGGCLLLSVANMGYATAAKSRTFWGLGLAGGVITAFLPLSQEHVLLCEALLSMVIATAFVTAGMQRWMKAVAGAWALFLLLQLPLIHSHLAWQIRVGHLEGISLAAILAYAWAYYEENRFDTRADAIKVFGIGSGLLGFYVQSGPMGSLHTSLLAAAIGAIALAVSSKPTLRRSLLFTSGALLLVLAPFGLSGWHTSAFMLGLAILLLISESRFKKVELTWLAAFELVAASLISLIRFGDFSKDIHLGLNGVMLATLIPLALSFRRHYDEETPIFAAHAMAGMFFASVIGVLLDNNNPPIGMPLTISWTVYGLGLLLMGLIAKVRDIRIAGILVLFATLCKVLLNDLSSVELIAKVAVLTGLGVAMLLGGYLVIRMRGDNQ